MKAGGDNPDRFDEGTSENSHKAGTALEPDRIEVCIHCEFSSVFDHSRANDACPHPAAMTGAAGIHLPFILAPLLS
jgi:hypothetical protein